MYIGQKSSVTCVSQKNETGFWKPMKNCIFWYVNENKRRCRGWESVETNVHHYPISWSKSHYFILFWNVFQIFTWLIIFKTEISYRGVSTEGAWGVTSPCFQKICSFLWKNLQFFYIERDHSPGAPLASSTAVCSWFHIIFVFIAKNWVDQKHEIRI
jgi:hypothetical protein